HVEFINRLKNARKRSADDDDSDDEDCSKKKRKMETADEYQLVFLNELHDKLKQLNTYSNRIAGLYRVLGRTVQKTNIIEKDTIDLTLDESEDDGNRYQSKQQRKQKKFTTEGGQIPQHTIDLTMDDSEDDGNRDQSRLAAVIGQGKQQILETKSIIKGGQMSQHAEKSVNIPKGGPKIVLQIDTSLLDPQWKYATKALFQFMGEVAYEKGHWVLQARSYRNMEGLDLFTYRKSIMLIRELKQHAEQP
ncbi:hypothetical protein BGX27_003409, partial [Mortierella sp. AM989]